MISGIQQLLLSLSWATILLLSVVIMVQRSRRDFSTKSVTPSFRTFLFVLVLVLYYWTFPRISSWLESHWLIGYYGALSLYLLFEASDLAWWMVGKISGFWMPPLLNRLFRTRSLAEFWAYRWNTFVNSWFREVSAPLRRLRPSLSVGLVFFFSGVWHEALINLPYFLITKQNFLGRMVLYFMIQFVGLSLQRLIPATKHRLITWLVVVVPAPLVFTEPTLRGLWLWR